MNVTDQEPGTSVSEIMGAEQPIQQQRLQEMVNPDTPVAGIGEAMFYGSPLTMDQDSQTPGIAMDIVTDEAEQSGGPGTRRSEKYHFGLRSHNGMK